MGKAATGKTGSLEYDGAAPIDWQTADLVGTTGASRLSAQHFAPFDYKIKEALFAITDTLAATTAVASLRINGTVVASISCNGLPTGLVDVKAGATTTWRASDFLVKRGDKVRFSIPNVASFGGQGIIQGNPI